MEGDNHDLGNKLRNNRVIKMPCFPVVINDCYGYLPHILNGYNIAASRGRYRDRLEHCASHPECKYCILHSVFLIFCQYYNVQVYLCKPIGLKALRHFNLRVIFFINTNNMTNQSDNSQFPSFRAGRSLWMAKLKDIIIQQ